MERLKRLQTEREVLEILASESHSETELLSEGSLYRDLLIQCMEKEFEEDDEIARWKEESFETSLRYADHLKISTLSGIKVRSKSESIIANELYAHGIPFRYECALELDQKVYFPDFTILRPYDKQIVYWEHFGLIGDMEYRKNTAVKVGNIYRKRHCSGY